MFQSIGSDNGDFYSDMASVTADLLAPTSEDWAWAGRTKSNWFATPPGLIHRTVDTAYRTNEDGTNAGGRCKGVR